MNVKVFEEACRLSCLEWAATLPDAPEYTLSKQAKTRLEMIVSHMEGGRYRRISKRTLRIFAVAAIISALLIATTAYGIIEQNDFGILRRADMSEYAVNGTGGHALSSDLKVSYVVDGFELIQTHYDANGIINSFVYMYDSDTFYQISQYTDFSLLFFDTEEYTAENMNINGIDYTYYKSNDNDNSLVWNYGGYIYRVNGDIPFEESLKIAESIEY